MEIMHKGANHMMPDDEHKKSIMGMEERTGENRNAWIKRMETEFDTKPND